MWAKLIRHKHEEHTGRYWLELQLTDKVGQPPRSRCIGDVLTLAQLTSRESAAASTLHFAGWELVA